MENMLSFFVANKNTDSKVQTSMSTKNTDCSKCSRSNEFVCDSTKEPTKEGLICSNLVPISLVDDTAEIRFLMSQ